MTMPDYGEPNTSWHYCGLCSAIVPLPRVYHHKHTDLHRIGIRMKWRQRVRFRSFRSATDDRRGAASQETGLTSRVEDPEVDAKTEGVIPEQVG